jgi:hypothetical protein
MPKKQLIDLKEARIERLTQEQKELERERKKQESANIKNQILAK